MGCDECEKNLKAELSSKDEENLSEEEKQILEGGEVPDYTGPLAPVDVDYCEFCHGIGQVGAMFFGAVIAYIVAVEVSSGIGVLAGLAVWLGLAVTVGYVGHFPFLGPIFGPIVEKVVALQFGIFVTEKAKQKYGPALADGGHRGGIPENRMTLDGPEMHLVAKPAPFEECAQMKDEYLARVEIDNGYIVDIHEFNGNFNRFPNLQDHVGYRNPNMRTLCDAKRMEGPNTTLDFSELLQQQGQGGVE